MQHFRFYSFHLHLLRVALCRFFLFVIVLKNNLLLQSKVCFSSFPFMAINPQESFLSTSRQRFKYFSNRAVLLCSKVCFCDVLKFQSTLDLQSCSFFFIIISFHVTLRVKSPVLLIQDIAVGFTGVKRL